MNITLVDISFSLNSPFLLNKYIGLSNRAKVAIIYWGPRIRTEYGFKLLNCPRSLILRLLNLIQLVFTHPLGLFYYYYKGHKVIGNKIFKRSLSDYPFIIANPRIIHFEFGTIAIDRVYLKEIYKCKIIVSFRGFDINYFGLNKHNPYRDVWKHADGFHFLGQDLYHRAIKRGYSQKGRDFFISPAIDVDFFKPLANKKFYISGKLRIISVGRLVFKKGYEFGILAVRNLIWEGYDIEYFIVGDGPHKQALEFAIYEFGLDSRIHLMGTKDPLAIRNLLEESDLFLHPAVSEGFCNSVIEAQAMFLPVVCSNADGLRENVENGVTGLVSPIYDVESLTNNMKYFLLEPQKIRDFGLAARERACRLFKLSDQIEKYMNMYNAILNVDV